LFESYCAFGEKKPIILFFREKVDKGKVPHFLRLMFSKWVRVMWPVDGTDVDKVEMLDSVCTSIIKAYTLLNNDVGGEDAGVNDLFLE
jgi:hypothetical protein